MTNEDRGLSCYLRRSTGLNVPLSSASCISCIFLISFSFPGTSIPLWMMALIWKGEREAINVTQGTCITTNLISSTEESIGLYLMSQHCRYCFLIHKLLYICTLSTATLTASGVRPVMRACRASSSPGWGRPNRPNFPSFVAPFPRIMILVLL